MNLSEFKSLFGTSIRAWLNWELLAKTSADIRQTVIVDREKLGDLRTVWYAAPNGEAGDWREADHTPQTVAEAAANPKAWDAKKASRIRKFHDQFSVFNEPLVLTLPAYQIGDELLLLDSIHRAVAAFLADVPVRLLILSIEGPIGSDILPDLGRFSDRVSVDASV